MRKEYRLLKDTPELRAGAIVQEKSDAGNQEYHTISSEWNRKPDQVITSFSRKVVMEQPEWFEEVAIFRLPQRLITKFEEFLKQELQ